MSEQEQCYEEKVGPIVILLVTSVTSLTFQVKRLVPCLLQERYCCCTYLERIKMDLRMCKMLGEYSSDTLCYIEKDISQFS